MTLFQHPSAERSILLIDAGYFLTREIHRALEQEGHHVVLIPFHLSTSEPLRDPGSYSGFLKTLIDAVEMYHPQILLTVNHLGFDAEGRLTELLEALKLPGLIWYVDSPRYILLDHYDNVSDQIGIFLWDDSYRQWMEQIGFQNVHFLPLATDPEVFQHTGELSGDDDDAPVIFVGDSMNDAVEKAFNKLPDEIKTELSDGQNNAFQILIREFCTTALQNERQKRQPAWDVLRNHQKLLPTGIRWTVPPNADHADPVQPQPNRQWLNLESALVLLATRLQRTRFIKDLASSEDYRPFIIYGDDGWKQTVNGTSRILPPVDYYQELPDIYHSAGAVLNLTGLQMPRALNQRCYDVPAAGGFLLTDKQAVLSDQFEPDQEIVCFATVEELREKYQFYRRHPEARRTVIEKGRKRILMEHTYRHRVREMLSMADTWFT